MYTLSIQDPYTVGEIYYEGREVGTIGFDFHTEDENEWVEQADETLYRLGWVRTSVWFQGQATLERI